MSLRCDVSAFVCAQSFVCKYTEFYVSSLFIFWNNLLLENKSNIDLDGHSRYIWFRPKVAF